MSIRFRHQQSGHCIAGSQSQSRLAQPQPQLVGALSPLLTFRTVHNVLIQKQTQKVEVSCSIDIVISYHSRKPTVHHAYHDMIAVAHYK